MPARRIELLVSKYAIYALPVLLAGWLAAPFAYAAGPVPVDLGKASRYAILTKTGITDVFASAVTGAVGTSPITGAADLLSCAEVTGRVVSVDAAGPAPCSNAHPAFLGLAVLDMQTAYTNAAGRAPDVQNLAGGNIGGLTIPPGVYNWNGTVRIPSDVTLQGGRKDVWIFQVAQDVDIASATSVVLSPGVLPRNIFWQVAGKVTLGTTAHFEGTILSKTLIAMRTGASINGRLLAQTAVTLQKNVVTLAR
jgi:Ice-binding-like